MDSLKAPVGDSQERPVPSGQLQALLLLLPCWHLSQGLSWPPSPVERYTLASPFQP